MSAELRMSAYYFSFEPTGVHSIDRVLSAVACAGKAFHSTDEWTSECEAYHPEIKGNSCRDWIQNAALEAAAEREDLLAALEAIDADYGSVDAIVMVRAAIAKGRGGR